MTEREPLGWLAGLADLDRQTPSFLLVYLVGPAGREREALGLAARAIARVPSLWFRANQGDASDIPTLIRTGAQKRPLILVEGLAAAERELTVRRAADLNLVRDALPGDSRLFIYVPRESASDVFGAMPDLWSWRSAVLEIELPERADFDGHTSTRAPRFQLPEPGMPLVLQEVRVATGVESLITWAAGSRAGIIVGHRGTGRSTALALVAQAEEERRAVGEGSIPIFVSARWLAWLAVDRARRRGLTRDELLTWLEDSSEAQLPDSARSEDTLLLLIDDIDSSTNVGRRKLWWALRTLVDTGAVRVLCTARSRSEAPDWVEEGELLPWRREAIIRYAEQYLRHHDTPNRDARMALLERLVSEESIQLAMATPIGLRVGCGALAASEGLVSTPLLFMMDMLNRTTRDQLEAEGVAPKVSLRLGQLSAALIENQRTTFGELDATDFVFLGDQPMHGNGPLMQGAMLVEDAERLSLIEPTAQHGVTQRNEYRFVSESVRDVLAAIALSAELDEERVRRVASIWASGIGRTAAVWAMSLWFAHSMDRSGTLELLLLGGPRGSWSRARWAADLVEAAQMAAAPLSDQHRRRVDRWVAGEA